MRDASPYLVPDWAQSRPQPGSALCFVCGTQNPVGLGVRFMDDGRVVWTEIAPREYHQGWPGVLHGGIIAALLDETIGRVAFLHDRWVQTAKLELRFHKPAPLGAPLRVTGELVRDARRLLEMRGRIFSAESGEMFAEASGTFIRLPDATRNELAKKLGGDFDAWEEWFARSRNTTEAKEPR